MDKPNFSAKLASDLIQYAGGQGADSRRLYEMLGIEKRFRNRDDVRVPAERMGDIWSLAHELTGDPFLAFHMGVEFSYSARDTHLMIMQSSSTVLEAFEQGMKYSDIVANVLAVTLGEDKDNFFMDYEPREEWQRAPAAVVRDSLAVSLVTNMISLQMCVGKFVAPTILTFQFPQPGIVNEFLGVFNTSIHFDQPHNRIGFPKDVSKLPISTSDNGLLGSLKRYGDELKSKIWPQNKVIVQVRNQVIHALTEQSTPTIEDIAGGMNMSARTLQRKLREEETSFKSELDTVRKELAGRYVEEGQKSLCEIAFLLGYANTTSFVRAYKRWNGTTPGKSKAAG